MTPTGVMLVGNRLRCAENTAGELQSHVLVSCKSSPVPLNSLGNHAGLTNCLRSWEERGRCINGHR
jgi:hypothetical protein